MKKIISIIPAVIMLLSLAGCGGQSRSTPQPSPAPKVLSETISLSRYDEATNTYINDYTGLEFTVSNGWEIQNVEDNIGTGYNSGYTTRQIQQMSADQLAELTNICDLLAVNSSSQDYILIQIAKPESVEDYLHDQKYQFSEFLAEETVVLSGVEYNCVKGRIQGHVGRVYYLVREDGHVVTVTHLANGESSSNFIHAVFNGGADLTVDEANVPDLSVVDRQLCRFVNRSTDMEVDVPTGWGYSTPKMMSELFSGIPEEQFLTMTKADFAKLDGIYDMYIRNNDTLDSVTVSYQNRKTPMLYGLSVEDISTHYRHLYEKDNCDVISGNRVEIGGYEYQVITKIYSSNSSVYHYLIRELNEDYILQIMRSVSDDTTALDIADMLGRNNDIDTVIRRSEKVEGKYQYYNRSTDITVNVLKDWQLMNEEMLTTLYGDSLTIDQLDSWTEADYLNAAVIPDFAVGGSDPATFTMVYYVNLNKVHSGIQIDYFQYYEEVISSLENVGHTIVERDVIYERNNREFWFVNSINADGSKEYQVAVAPIGEDYVLVLYNVATANSGRPKPVGMMPYTGQ